MDDAVRAFYDALAPSYDLLFADWLASMQRQAAALERIIVAALGNGPASILDCACGIGTQAIGLALRGHHVHATDFSPAAVARAEREARVLGARLTFGVADMRALEAQVGGTFDIVLAADNALPHLMDDDDLHQGIANMAAKLRPDGLLLASIRDYDRLVQERPRTEGPRVFDDPAGRRIAFQIWDWAADGRTYEVHQFIVRQDGQSWSAQHFATPYRALLRAELETVLMNAGLGDICWHEPEQSEFFQPIVTARVPTIASLQCAERASRKRSTDD